MASVKTIEIFRERPWRAGLVKRRYRVTLTDNNAVDHVTTLMPSRVDPADDGTTAANDLLESQKNSELSNEDKATQWHDSQADYDRRALGFAMTLDSTDEFFTYLPLFKAMELRGGNNPGQRATYLGVQRADYDLMADRFNDVEGVAFFLTDAKGQVWDEIPEDWQ